MDPATILQMTAESRRQPILASLNNTIQRSFFPGFLSRFSA
jgi:hypothetical protein